jgi:predicted nucleic acid-binding Zn ribbon protein
MTNHQTIGDYIQQFFVQKGKLSLLLEQKAVELWAETVGEFIAKQTTKISAKQGVLYVTIPNAALRFEILNSRTQIIAKINNKLGCEAIKGIIIKL